MVPKYEEYACESRACPSFTYKVDDRVVDRSNPTPHETYFFEENGVKYQVLICGFCESHTFIVLNDEGFQDEEGGSDEV